MINWTKHRSRDGWTVCETCGMVRNYQAVTDCRGALPPVETREALVERVRELEAENEALHLRLARVEAQHESRLARCIAAARLLAERGCDCECDHSQHEHDSDCERCFPCRIDAALWPHATPTKPRGEP